MNKYEEALDTVKCKATTNNFICDSNKRRNLRTCRECDFVKAITDLEELVEKATPKKPIKVNDPDFDIRTCPCCGFRVVTHQNYCQGCGQKLRSEEE